MAKKVDKNVQKIKELEAKCTEYQDMLKRLQAEFENFKKHQERQVSQSLRFSCATFLIQMLPVLDSFEIAMQNQEAKTQLQPLNDQLTKTLNGLGLVGFDSVGMQFDANLHEVLLKEQNPNLPDNQITQQVQKGYMLHDKVLRHAKVKVNRNDKSPDSKKKN